jgi:osmoprotectant transport system substrate-binding protein
MSPPDTSTNRKATTVSDSLTPQLRAPRRRRSRTASSLAAAGLAVLLVGACSSSKSTSSGPTSTVAGASGVTLKFKALDAGGPLTVSAIKSGTVDIGELFTFAPAISKNKWVVLADDQHLQAADNFAPAIRTAKVTPEITKVLNLVEGKLIQPDVADMVDQVANKGQNPDAVAKAWLTKHGVPGNLTATGSLKVGTANFTESEIVGQIYGQALQQAGVDVTMKPDFGSRQVTTPALENGTLDLMPEFTTSLLTYLNPDAVTSSDLNTTYASVKKAAAAKGITILPPSLVNDVNVFVVTPATASKYHLASLSDLAKVTSSLTLGGAPECPKNAQCLIGLERVYGLKFAVQ